MKKGILLLLGMMTIATVNAKTINTSTNKIGVNDRFDNAVTFVERGIQFHVFLNGDFDFDTNFDEPRYVDYYGRRTRANRGTRIERDYQGRVRCVGNTFINYDIEGNVNRIGSVYMRYRYGQLIEIGNMDINYDRYGYPHFYGEVKYNNYCEDIFYEDNGFSIDITIGDVCDYDDVYFYHQDFRDNYRQYREDENFLYYRALPNANIGKRNKVLKRRKPSTDIKREYRTHEERSKRITSSNSRRTSVKPTRRSTEPQHNYSLERKENKNERRSDTRRSRR